MFLSSVTDRLFSENLRIFPCVPDFRNFGSRPRAIIDRVLKIQDGRHNAQNTRDKGENFHWTLY